MTTKEEYLQLAKWGEGRAEELDRLADMFESERRPALARDRRWEARNLRIGARSDRYKASQM